MNATTTPENQSASAEAERKAGFAGPPGSAIPFLIGDRTYWVGRDDRRNGYRIVANGDMVEYASALHYGDVGAFRRIAQRLEAIEDQWAQNSKLTDASEAFGPAHGSSVRSTTYKESEKR
jgi:hypothetical protein